MNVAELEAIAGRVCDPELPPLTLADLGILRSVKKVDDDTVVVEVTPTYSGCPAVEFIEDRIRRELELAGCGAVEVIRSFSPAWTSDWITTEGHRKLREAGIAPPRPVSGPADDRDVPVTLGRTDDGPVPCPRCDSSATTLISQFGSTACKALYRCDNCSEPFDHFKEI